MPRPDRQSRRTQEQAFALVALAVVGAVMASRAAWLAVRADAPPAGASHRVAVAEDCAPAPAQKRLTEQQFAAIAGVCPAAIGELPTEVIPERFARGPASMAGRLEGLRLASRGDQYPVAVAQAEPEPDGWLVPPQEWFVPEDQAAPPAPPRETGVDGAPTPEPPTAPATPEPVAAEPEPTAPEAAAEVESFPPADEDEPAGPSGWEGPFDQVLPGPSAVEPPVEEPTTPEALPQIELDLEEPARDQSEPPAGETAGSLFAPPVAEEAPSQEGDEAAPAIPPGSALDPSVLPPPLPEPEFDPLPEPPTPGPEPTAPAEQPRPEPEFEPEPQPEPEPTPEADPLFAPPEPQPTRQPETRTEPQPEPQPEPEPVAPPTAPRNNEIEPPAAETDAVASPESVPAERSRALPLIEPERRREPLIQQQPARQSPSPQQERRHPTGKLFDAPSVHPDLGKKAAADARAAAGGKSADESHAELFAKNNYPSALECAEVPPARSYDQWKRFSSHAYAFVSPMFHKFEQTITDAQQRHRRPLLPAVPLAGRDSDVLARASTPIGGHADGRQGGRHVHRCHRVNQRWGKSNGERRIVPGDIHDPVYGGVGGEGVATAIADN